MPDDPAAILARIKERGYRNGATGAQAGNDLFLADELGYLRACLEAAAVRPEAFDMSVLAPRLGRAVDALERVLELADVWDAASAITTAQLADLGMPAAVSAMESGTAGNPRAADLRTAITAALAGKEAGGGE